MIKQGESLFIPFLNGEGVRDAHQKARTYKSIDACRKALKRDFDKVEIVEYAPVRLGEWIPLEEPQWNCFGLITIGYRCSECGREEPDNHELYCRCGAKMGAKEDER